MSTSETITRTDLTNILNEVLPSTHGIGITKGSWTSSGTSAYNVKVTSDLTLSKGLYLVTIHTPYVASGSGLIGLRINGTADSSCNIVAPANGYARGAFLVDLSAQSTIAGYSEGSSAVTYTALDRGGIEAVQLVRYTESPEADFIVEQGTSGIWTYRKWNSGIAECWGKTDVASTTYSANGGYKNVTENLPSGLFNTTPSVVIADGNINSVIASDIGFTAPNSTASVQTYLINRYNASVTKTGVVFWSVKGRWK